MRHVFRRRLLAFGVQCLQAIVAMDMDLTETFKMFDKDGDGTVDIKEAKQARAGHIHMALFIRSFVACLRSASCACVEVLEKFNLGLSRVAQHTCLRCSLRREDLAVKIPPHVIQGHPR